MCIAMIGVDSTRSDKRWRTNLGSMCAVYDTMSQLVIPQANEHRVYIFVLMGDVFMLAHSSPPVMIRLLAAVAKAALEADWPCCIELKMAMHIGVPTVVETEAGSERAKVSYRGADVDLVRAIWRRDVGSAHVVLTHSSLPALVPDETKSFIVGEPVEAGVDGAEKVMIQLITFPMSNAKGPSNPLAVSDDSSDRAGQASDWEDSIDDELSKLVTSSTSIPPPQRELLKHLAVDLLQKFLRVLSFDDQVGVITTIASKLRVSLPRVPEMKTAMKKSFNVLKNSLRQICGQLLLSVDEREMTAWVRAISEHAARRELHEGRSTPSRGSPLSEPGNDFHGRTKPVQSVTNGPVSSDDVGSDGPQRPQYSPQEK
jgi:hypothetical protein